MGSAVISDGPGPIILVSARSPEAVHISEFMEVLQTIAQRRIAKPPILIHGRLYKGKYNKLSRTKHRNEQQLLYIIAASNA